MAIEILEGKDAGHTAARGALIRIVGYIVGLFANAFAARLVWNYLNVSQNSDYTTIFALITIIMLLAEAGMTMVGIREYVRLDRHKQTVLLQNLLGLRLFCMSVGVIIAIVYAFLQGYNTDMVWGVAAGGIGAIFTLGSFTLGIPLQASLRLGWVTFLDVFRQVSLAGCVGLVILFHGSLLQLFLVPFPAAVLLLVLTLFVVRRHGVWRPAFHFTYWRSLLKLTGPFAIVTTVGAMYFFITQILLSAIATTHESGIYGVSFRIFIALVIVPGLLASSFFPIIAHAGQANDEERLQTGIRQLLQIFLLLAGLTAFTVVSLAPSVVDVLASSEYREAIGVLQVHGFALAGTFLAACGGYPLLALGHARPLIVVNILGLIVNILGVITFVKVDGARGAAMGNLLGEITLATGYWIILCRRCKIRVQVRSLCKALVPSCCALPILLFQFTPLVTFLVGGTIFCLTTLMSGALPGEIIKMLLRPLLGLSDKRLLKP